MTHTSQPKDTAFGKGHSFFVCTAVCAELPPTSAGSGLSPCRPRRGLAPDRLRARRGNKRQSRHTSFRVCSSSPCKRIDLRCLSKQKRACMSGSPAPSAPLFEPRGIHDCTGSAAYKELPNVSREVYRSAMPAVRASLALRPAAGRLRFALYPSRAGTTCAGYNSGSLAAISELSCISVLLYSSRCAACSPQYARHWAQQHDQ